MNINNIMILMVIAFTFYNLQAAIITNPSLQNRMNLVDSLRADSLILRLNKIGSRNKLDLTATQRGILRKEVQTIKKNLKVIHGGIYLSLGTLIIILLLLIILF